jgi:hypothetical protein
VQIRAEWMDRQMEHIAALTTKSRIAKKAQSSVLSAECDILYSWSKTSLRGLLELTYGTA